MYRYVQYIRFYSLFFKHLVKEYLRFRAYLSRGLGLHIKGMPVTMYKVVRYALVGYRVHLKDKAVGLLYYVEEVLRNEFLAINFTAHSR